MKKHVVVIAAAVVFGEAHACSNIRCQRSPDIEGRDALLLSVKLKVVILNRLYERGHLGGDIDLAAHARPGSGLHARRSLDDVDGIHAVETDRGSIAVEREAVAHTVEVHISVLTPDARHVRLPK